MSELRGMTGFARRTGDENWGAWAWEAKSVNGRGLDVRVSTPPGFDALERHVKTTASRLFNRGSLQVSLRIELSAAGDEFAVNTAFLEKLISSARQVHGADMSAEAVATLMSVKGVVEAGGDSIRDLARQEEVMALLAKAADATLEELAAARLGEGQAVLSMLSSLLDELEATVSQASDLAVTQPALLKSRLEKQLAELGAREQVDRERLAAEVAVTSAKADVREELDRLNAHVEAARDLLKAGSPAGRKLDFLAQELNREANTLCSKSVSLDLTNAGLTLKGIIDQFKEQAANVE